jgi:hypothetical protein
MRIHIGKGLFRAALVCLLLLGGAPLAASGKILLETDTATGTVTGIDDNVITLDSWAEYYPAREDMAPDVKIGDTITLRYFTDGEQKNRYTEVAAGKNSLSDASVPRETKRGLK